MCDCMLGLYLLLSFQVVPHEGAWDRQMRGKRFVRGVNVNRWAVLLLTRDVARHVIQYVSVSHACHMTVCLNAITLLLLNNGEALCNLCIFPVKFCVFIYYKYGIYYNFVLLLVFVSQ